ncbi:MAG: cyclopropane-fatty-acyl-phospholipid synthase [Prosthecochloris sp.]|nr:cyclopropane-fatty-acyl-phospholipid synthase [Prosthecochloris sp.]
MFDQYCKYQVEKLFDSAGIRVNGSNPWDITVHDHSLYPCIVVNGNLGFGETYMDGCWDCDALDELFYRILRNRISRKVGVLNHLAHALIGHIRNFQNPSRSFIVGEKHYNTGNDLFAAMLDSGMNYSCGYWENCDNLEEAQNRKLRLVFEKLTLQPGMKVLDIGCGWGGAARYAAENYGVEVTGVTISQKQADYAKKYCESLPVSIQLCDYRKLQGTYDRIYSIGMFEHVGYKNYRHFFDVIDRCISTDGRCLLHTIGGNEPSTCTDPWISRYIFPNSMIPSASQITSAYEGKLVLEDWHVFAYDYYLTLKSWHQNVLNNRKNLEADYCERFFRMWEYYLLSCAGAFRARHLQIWQLLLTPKGITGRYRVPR